MSSNAKEKIVLRDLLLLFILVAFMALPIAIAQEVPAHVVISEVYPDAVNESDSEWIELYNPTEADINIGGWTIDTATHISDATIPAGATIPAHGFYLIADAGFSTGKDNPSWPNADLEDEMSLRNGDGWCRLNNSGSIVDTVGWGTATTNETQNAAKPAENKSIERKSLNGGYAPAQDTDDNSFDFTVQGTPTPKNSAAPAMDPAPVELFDAAGNFKGGFNKIQDAVDSASDGYTILVHDGTYNENVDVTKSHLTIRSANGPSVTTVSASLNHNKHVFDISDQTNVTLKGFEIRDAHDTKGVQDVAGIYMYNASECSISNNIVTNISVTGDHNSACGIYLRSSSDNNSFHTTTVYNISAFYYACGIYLGSSSDNNSFDTSTVYNLDAYRYAYGIRLYSSSDNSFTSGSISDINALTWWDFYSEEDAHGNSARDITISSFPTTISFTYDNGIKLKSVATPPADPGGKLNIGKYVNAVEVTADSWIFMNVSYEEGDLGGVAENSLRLWKHNGTDWTEVPGTNGVNTAENYVYTNITEFSVFAPLGNPPAPPLNCTCGDICVNTTGWWRDGGAFNPSNTPIQHAIDNATAGDTICVKDGTYNENVDVTKSDLTIRSVNGPSVTTVSASLNPDDHVFDITDQTNVTLRGFEIRDAHGTTQDVAGIYMNNASECDISDNVVTDISAAGWFNDAYGIWLEDSNDNSFTSSTEVSYINTDATWGRMAYGIYIGNSNNNSFSSSTSVSYINSGILEASGIFLSYSNNNSFSSSTDVSYVNAFFGEASGITLWGSNNNSFSSSTNVFSITASAGAYGIRLLDSNNNRFSSSTSISYIDATFEAFGILLGSSNNNRFSSSTSISYVNATDWDAFGIYLWFSSDNSFSSGSISDINAPDWWDFYSEEDAHGNSAEDITISSFPTTISFTYDKGIKLKSVATPPADPADMRNISKYVTVTEVSAESWIFMNVSYEDVDLGGVDENSLRMWKHNGTDWTEVPVINGVNTAENYVYANITEFSVFAPLGNVTGAKLEINKTGVPDPVSPGETLNYTIRVNNTGNATATNVTVTETYDGNVTFVAALPAPSLGNDTWKFATLNVSETKWINISVLVNASAPNGTVLHNIVNVTCDEGVTDSDTEDTTVLSAVAPVLEINKTSNPDPVLAGGTLNYSISVNNTGNATATNVTVTEKYDENVTFVSAVPAPSLDNDTWVFATLNVSETKWINISVLVNASAPNRTVLHNIVNVTCDEGVTDSDTEDTTVLSAVVPVLEINKTGVPDPVPAGGTLNYSIRVNNTGNATATNVTVKETYDGNVTFVMAVPAPSPGNDTWQFATLNASETRRINISVTVNASVLNGTVLHNIVNVTCDEGVSDSDTEDTTVLSAAAPVLEINKTGVPDPVPAGGTLNYSISVNNTGNATATNVTVKETYDGNVTFVTAVPAPSSGNDTWQFATLNVSERRWINISVIVNASVLNGTVLHNIVNVTCDEGVTDVDTEDTTVLSALAPVLEINKTGVPDPVLAGGTLNYSIRVNNTGNATATNVTVMETYDENVTFVAAVPAPSSGDDTWQFATLNVSERRWINISVIVNASVLNGTVLHNIVNVTCDEGVTDTDTENTTVFVAPVPVLEITKTDAPDPVSPGGTLNYSICVNNTGNATATNVTVMETYDGNVTFVTAVPVPSQGNDTWQFPTLNTSETRRINISVTVNASVPNGTVLHNIVNVSCDEGVTDSDTEATTVLSAAVPVLEINKTSNPDPVPAGGTLNYSIRVNNTGNATATNVTVKETYDGNVTFVMAVPAPSPGNDTWQFATLNVSETRRINISVTVNASVLNGTVLHNIVNVTCDEGVSDSDTEDTTVLSAAAPVLEINKTGVPDPVPAGGTLNYSISVNNTGNATATNVTVKETYDGNVTFVTAVPAPSPGNDTWQFATLNASETRWINISVTVNASVLNGTVLHNIVNVTCDEGVMDSDTEDTTVLSALAPILEINKTGVPDPVLAGGTLNYSIRVNNTGNATATNVTVMETYDENVTFVTAVPAPSSGNDTWQFATLNVSERRWINISVTVNASVLNGTVLHNIVNVTCDEGVMDSDTADTTVLFKELNCTCGDICVNETGWWQDGGAFNTSGTPIQAAIDNATARDVICVKDGTYNENVDVYKRLTIRSENGAASTSVRGASPHDWVFEVTADYVNISGFHVTDATNDASGIYLYGANYCNISDNNANENYYHGIFLNSSSDNTLVNNNANSNNESGIYLYLDSNNNYLINNTASENKGDGFKLESNSNHNRIIGNNASDNDKNGIRLYGTTGNPSSHNIVANNTVDFNDKSGIMIEGADSDHNTIVNNTCKSNDYGISIRYGDYNNLTKNTCNQNSEYGIRLYQSADNNEITNNTAISNTEYGIYISSSDYNIIYNNYFNNTNNAWDNGNNVWNITKTLGTNIIGGPYLGGNYWSDYAGRDTNGDGLGDTLLPYNSSGGITNDGDYHPLVPVGYAPVLSIEKSDNPDPVSPGETLNYTIRVNNTGNATATNVTVTEKYDENVTFVSAVPAPSLDNDTWVFATLNVSETKWINISVLVNASAPNGTVLHNIVNVSCDEGVSDSDTEDTTVFVAPAPPPNITSFAPPSPVNDTVCNWTTFNVTVNQTVNVSWYLNNTLRHTNVSTKEANFTLHAEVVGEHNVSAIASNANGTDMQTWVWNVTAAPLPVLEINKTGVPDPVSPGGILNYSIRVNNTGNATATNVIVTETYDENVTFLDAVPAPSHGSDTWIFATLNAGEMKWINISVTVNASVLNETVLHNFVNVSCDEGVTDSDTEDTTVLSLPECIETATGTGIACFETGAGTIEDLVAVDASTLPEAGKPALVFPHGFFSFDITGLTPGQTVVVTVTLPGNVPVGTQYWKYHAPEGGWIQIPMGSDDGDPVITITLVDGGLGDDDGTANGVIVDQGGPGMSLGISVTKVADPPDVAPSSNVKFTITVSNTGVCTLNPVRVVDTLLGWMSYVSSSPAADTHDGTIIWNNVGPLDPGDSKTITLVARIASGASGSVTNAVTVTGTSPTGEEVTDSDTVTVTVLARTIEPPTKTLIDVTTEIKSDGIVIEGEQFGWEAGNGNLLNNPPISPGEAVGSIKYDDKMIGSNGTTEFTKNSGVNTNVTPNIAVTKDIGYKSGDLGSLSNAEQAGMRYYGASPPLSSTTKCEDVNAHSKMVVTDVDAATETEVGITETEGRDLHYGIDAEGKGSVSAGVDASASSMSYKDKSNAYGGNFSLHKTVDYTSKPSTSITTDLKGDSTVVEEGQFRGGSGNDNLKYDDKMIGSNGTTEFEKYVDASTTNLAVDKSIGYKSGDLGSLSYDEQVGVSNTKCKDVNAYGKMVATNVETETEVEITRRSLYYGINAEGNGSVAAGVDAFVADGGTDMASEDKSNAYGNFTFSKEIGYNKPP